MNHPTFDPVRPLDVPPMPAAIDRVAALLRSLKNERGIESRGGANDTKRILSTFVARPSSIDRVWFADPDSAGRRVVRIGRNRWTTWAGTVSAESWAALCHILSAVPASPPLIDANTLAWRHRITIECPTCGLTKRVDRQPHDPKQAHRCEIKCPECIGSDFEQTFYFDENGRQLVSDDGDNWRPL